jgi:hypothetical protein
VEVPHPIAAGNRLEGWTVKGGGLCHRVARRPLGAPLTGLPWRATSSVAGEAPVPVQTWPVLVAAWRLAMALMRADNRDGLGVLLRVLARRATAGRQGRAGADAGPAAPQAPP